MAFTTVLYTLLIGPLEFAFEIVYSMAYRATGHPGMAIVLLSLAVNILVLPLYKRADAMQEEERQMQQKLERGVNHIKKTFRGDERMMMLQTYYRQNHYKPTYVLRSASSLILQIPFFIAAYQFLSGLTLLEGAGLGPIANLGKPDGLLFGINFLPILMTAINMVSTVIFTRGYPRKDKIQLYAMALFFLVFLYDSPAGLVFYWTLNNVFSLVKTVFYKLKNPKKVLHILLSLLGIGMLAVGISRYSSFGLRKLAFFFGGGIGLQLPVLQRLLKEKWDFGKWECKGTPNGAVFLAGGLLLSVLVGGLIPSAVLEASPQEFVDISYFYHPLWYVFRSGLMAAGTFLIWLGVFYWLASPKGKVLFQSAVWAFALFAVVNYMAFDLHLGNLLPSLKYEADFYFPRVSQLLNIAVLLALAAGGYWLLSRWPGKALGIISACAAAVCIMVTVNALKINKEIEKLAPIQAQEQEDVGFTLSKTGKNVVVVMLDRGLGGLVPYIFQEKPELEKKFAGFTYYDNVISFGGFTNVGSPALYGGYAYTPMELNKRDTELLKDKHNEALKVMPAIFAENGYEVTVADPPYANYEWIPDLSIYDDIPGVNAYLTPDGNTLDVFKEQRRAEWDRNFFCYSLMRALPLTLQGFLYDDGNYYKLYERENLEIVARGVETESGQGVKSLYTSVGIYFEALKEYSKLRALPEMTEIVETDTNTLALLDNNLTHEPMLFQMPDYVPALWVDNTKFEGLYNYEVNGRKLNLDNTQQMIHYHANMAALLQLGSWFDYLREMGVYDNTRIILVADHGREIVHVDDMLMDLDGQEVYAGWYFPLLMVKDFGSSKFTTSHEFMTNADVPTIAMESLIADPVNPFTGNPVDNREKTAHDQYILDTMEYSVFSNNGTQFLPDTWLSVHDDIWDPSNWSLVTKNAVSPFA